VRRNVRFPNRGRREYLYGHSGIEDQPGTPLVLYMTIQTWLYRKRHGNVFFDRGFTGFTGYIRLPSWKPV